MSLANLHRFAPKKPNPLKLIHLKLDKLIEEGKIDSQEYWETLKLLSDKTY